MSLGDNGHWRAEILPVARFGSNTAPGFKLPKPGKGVAGCIPHCRSLSGTQSQCLMGVPSSVPSLVDPRIGGYNSLVDR